MTNANSTPGFAQDIQPLFRESDRQAMNWRFDLWDYQDVRSHSQEILERLDDGSMPCDQPWPSQQVDQFRRWIAGGMPR